MRSALRVHQHSTVVLLLDSIERGENVVVLRGGDVRHELAASGRHKEIEIPHFGCQPIVREIGDRFELAGIV
jgi:hypothetical protein